MSKVVAVYQKHRALFFLVAFAVSGLVWAATVIRDGSVGDWGGVAPAVVDPKGDAPADADIVAVFYQQDSVNLYLRFDADIRTTTVNQAPIVNAVAAALVLISIFPVYLAQRLSGDAAGGGRI